MLLSSNAEGQEEIKFFDQTYTNPNYDPNRKGRNGTHQFTQYLGVKGYPTMVFFSENGDPIMPVVGYLKPQQLELYLKLIKQGDYQVFSKPEDFQNYQKSFYSSFPRLIFKPPLFSSIIKKGLYISYMFFPSDKKTKEHFDPSAMRRSGLYSSNKSSKFNLTFF